jgi:hypothetical protein
MTMAEDKWPHLHQILQSSDNHDTLLTNYPLHVYMFYCNYLNNIYNKLWKSFNLTRWKKWEHFFECDEFQNRETIHMHGFAYTEKKTLQLISLDIIYTDILDPDTKPELYCLVTIFQTHHCDYRYRLQHQNNDELCSKGFLQPLSEMTHCSPNSLHYIYRHTKEED